MKAHEALRKRREVLQLTQRRIAEKLGCSRPWYALIELGHRSPGWDLALRIEDQLGIDAKLWKDAA